MNDLHVQRCRNLMDSILYLSLPGIALISVLAYPHFHANQHLDRTTFENMYSTSIQVHQDHLRDRDKFFLLLNNNSFNKTLKVPLNGFPPSSPFWINGLSSTKLRTNCSPSRVI